MRRIPTCSPPSLLGYLAAHALVGVGLGLFASVALLFTDKLELPRLPKSSKDLGTDVIVVASGILTVSHWPSPQPLDCWRGRRRIGAWDAVLT